MSGRSHYEATNTLPLPGVEPARTHGEIAAIVGVSRRRVQQLEKRAFYKMRLAILQDPTLMRDLVANFS